MTGMGLSRTAGTLLPTVGRARVGTASLSELCPAPARLSTGGV